MKPPNASRRKGLVRLVLGLGQRARRLGALLREGRWGEIVKVVGRPVPRWLVHVDVFVVTQLVEPVPLSRRRRGAVVREAQAAEAGKLARVFQADLGALTQRFATGHTCLVCEVNGELAGMSWVDLGGVHDEPDNFCRFVLPQDAAWVYHLAIVPAWQLSGALAMLLEYGHAYVRERARLRVCGITSVINEASLRAHISFGHEVVAKIFVLNVAGVRMHRMLRFNGRTPRATWIGFRSWPSIDLRAALESGSPS